MSPSSYEALALRSSFDAVCTTVLYSPLRCRKSPVLGSVFIASAISIMYSALRSACSSGILPRIIRQKKTILEGTGSISRE